MHAEGGPRAQGVGKVSAQTEDEEMIMGDPQSNLTAWAQWSLDSSKYSNKVILLFHYSLQCDYRFSSKYLR